MKLMWNTAEYQISKTGQYADVPEGRFYVSRYQRALYTARFNGLFIPGEFRFSSMAKAKDACQELYNKWENRNAN